MSSCLQRELTGLDGLIPSSWFSTSKLANGSQSMFDIYSILGRRNNVIIGLLWINLIANKRSAVCTDVSIRRNLLIE